MNVWVNGEVLAEAHAHVSVFDHGFTVADGVFETLKVVDGVPFAISRHLERLQRSAERMGLTPPDLAQLRAGIAEVVPGDLAFGRLRITVTGGPGPLGSERSNAPLTLVIAVTSATPWPEQTSLATVPWTRNEHSAIAGVKSTSYAENVVALQYAHDRGASEAVFANTAGELCEGTGTNVFVVVDGEVLTPALVCGPLAGITRELVLEWSDAREARLPASVLRTADEVFITSSTRDVHPVTKIDERDLSVGPVTQAIQAEFARRSALDVDP